MTEIAIPEQVSGVLMSAPMRLVEWADEARAAHALAESLCRTPFAGQFKGDPLAATAAILRGSELGLTPVTSLGAFDLIQGTPAPKAVTLRALVQSHGHSVWIVSSSDSECVAKARRFGEDVEHTSTWTIERAQRMGLTGKDNWKKQPAAMLIARATSEVCRLVAADLLLGIGNSSEELRDEPRRQQAGPASAPRSIAELTSGAVESAADVTPPDVESPGPVSDPGVTKAQLAKVAAQLRDLGLTERGPILELVTDVVGRPIGSRNDLTRAEASRLVEYLALQLGEIPEVGDAEVVS